MYSLLNIEFAGVINYIEYNTDDLFLQTLEGYNGQGMSDVELGYLYPGQWTNYGRPDIAAYIQSINPADESDDNTDTQNQVMGGTSTGGSDGSILSEPFGGTPPYNTQNLYNLSAGTYTIYVEDSNGCLEEKEYVVTEPGDQSSAPHSLRILC